MALNGKADTYGEQPPKPSGEWSEKTVTIGHYPQAGWKARLPVGLAEARRENARLRALEAQCADPALQRKEEKAEALNARLAEEQRAKAGISFEDFVCEWMDKVSECSRGTETEYAYRPETARAILREWREEKYPPPVVVNNWQRCMGLFLFLLSPLEPGSRGQRQEPDLKKISPR